MRAPHRPGSCCSTLGARSASLPAAGAVCAGGTPSEGTMPCLCPGRRLCAAAGRAAHHAGCGGDPQAGAPGWSPRERDLLAAVRAHPSRRAASRRQRAAPPGHQSLRRFVPAALVVGVLIAAAAGFLLGGSSSSTGEAFSNSASAGYLELSFPACRHAWPALPRSPGSRSQSRSRWRGRHHTHASASGQRLLAGEVSCHWPFAAPGSAHRFTQRHAALPLEAVPRASLRAYCYAGLSVRGLSGKLTLFVVPTGKGRGHGRVPEWTPPLVGGETVPADRHLDDESKGHQRPSGWRPVRSTRARSGMPWPHSSTQLGRPARPMV